jgi:AcrR family transcriptional regulator
MTASTKQHILKVAKRLYAVNGYEGFSMRILAKESGVGLSSIYHFFKDKDELLEDIYNATNRQLGDAREKLPKSESAEEMLLGRIKFQFEFIEDVVYVLKYYIHFRPSFLKLDTGYFPAKGYLHIEEVLEYGVYNGEFTIHASEIDKEAKVITHAINGFLLEYYPNPPEEAELEEVTSSIHNFLMRSLTNPEVRMK